MSSSQKGKREDGSITIVDQSDFVKQTDVLRLSPEFIEGANQSNHTAPKPPAPKPQVPKKHKAKRKAADPPPLVPKKPNDAAPPPAQSNHTAKKHKAQSKKRKAADPPPPPPAPKPQVPKPQVPRPPASKPKRSPISARRQNGVKTAKQPPKVPTPPVQSQSRSDKLKDGKLWAPLPPAPKPPITPFAKFVRTILHSIFTEEVLNVLGEYVHIPSNDVKEYARKAAIMVEGGTLPHPPELTKDTTVAMLRDMAASNQEFEGFYRKRNGINSRFATTAEIKPMTESEIWQYQPDADEKDGCFFVTDDLVIALLAMLPRKGFISPNPVDNLGKQICKWDCQQKNRLFLNLVRGVTSTGHVDSGPIGLHLEVRNPDAELRDVEGAEAEGLSEKEKKQKRKQQRKAEKEAEAKRENIQYPNKLDISVYLPSLLAVIAIVSQFHGEDGNEIASAFHLLLEVDNAQFAAADAANRGEAQADAYQLKAEADSKQEQLNNLITKLLVAPDIKKCVTNVEAAFSDWAKQTNFLYYDWETMEERAQSEVRSVQKKIREEGLHRSLGDWPGDLNLEKHFGITKDDLVAFETIGQYLEVAKAIVADRGHKLSTWTDTSIENIGFDNADAHTQMLQLCQPAMEQHAADQHEALEAYHNGMDHPGADEQFTFTRIVCEMDAKQMLTLWLTANQTTPEDTKAAGEVLTRPVPPSLKWFQACITTVQCVLLQHQLQPAFMMSMLHMLIGAEKRVTEAAKEAAKEAAEEAAKDTGETWDEKVFEENWTPPEQMIGDFNYELLQRYGTPQKMGELIQQIQKLYRDVCSEKSPLHTLLETLDSLITDPSKWPDHVKACIPFTDEETEMWNELCTLFKKLDSVNADSTGLLKDLLGDWESHRKTPANARLHILALVVLNEYSPVNLLVFNSPSECIAQFEGGSDENVKTAPVLNRSQKTKEIVEMVEHADSVKSTFLSLTDAVRNLIPSDGQAQETALALVSKQDRQNADSTQPIITTTTRNLIEVDGLGKDHEKSCDMEDDPKDTDRNPSDANFDGDSDDGSVSGDESDESIDEKVWSDLLPEQRDALEKLGYDSEMWDDGKHPERSYKEFEGLEKDEVDLWKIMDRNEDNWLFWLDNESSSEYSYASGSD